MVYEEDLEQKESYLHSIPAIIIQQWTMDWKIKCTYHD